MQCGCWELLSPLGEPGLLSAQYHAYCGFMFVVVCVSVSVSGGGSVFLSACHGPYLEVGGHFVKFVLSLHLSEF